MPCTAQRELRPTEPIRHFRLFLKIHFGNCFTHIHINTMNQRRALFKICEFVLEFQRQRHGMAGREAAMDRLGKLHVFDAVGEGREFDFLFAPDRIDEFLLDAPFGSLVIGNLDLGWFGVALAAADQLAVVKAQDALIAKERDALALEEVKGSVPEIRNLIESPFISKMARRRKRRRAFHGTRAVSRREPDSDGYMC